MFKLAKWTLIGLVGAGAAGYFCFGNDLFSYVGTAANSVRDSVRGEVPVDFEIKRAETLIEDIKPQIENCRRELYRAEARRDKLAKEIGELEIKVAAKERKLQEGAAILAGSNGTATYRLAGRNYTRERVELDLARTLDAYKREKSLLGAKKAHHTRQAAAVEAAAVRLDAVKAEQVRLTMKIGDLKTQKAQLDAMKATATHVPQLDTTALGKARKLLEDVSERLAVEQKMVENDEFFHNGIGGVAKPIDRDVLKEIHEEFGGDEPTAPRALTPVRGQR